MMYGAERWGVKKGQEKRLDVAEMRMLRWMIAVTKVDRIWNERIRTTTKVDKISKKCRKVKVEVVWACIEKRRRIAKRVMLM